MSLSIIETGTALGAEIVGVDLTRPIEDATFNQIQQAFYRYEVIFFRGQELSDADHIRISARFGALHKPKQREEHAAQLAPEISVISNIVANGKNIGIFDAGLFWHTDGCTHKDPWAASVLRALEVPERDGRILGDTLFSSVSTAYDALSEPMKKRLERLEAVNSMTQRFEKAEQSGRKSYKDIQALRSAPTQETETVHPVVRVHPVTGRKCLYVSEGFTVRIVGLAEDESRELLAELTAHCVKPEFQYRHKWRTHDLVMWDDCSTQHKATIDYALPQRRLMHKTTVLGVRHA